LSDKLDERILIPQPVHWIDHVSQLPALCQQLQSQPLLAVDTEFVRTNTFYPIPGLIQIATPTDIWLVDPVRIPRDDLQSLGECLFAADKTLLMHSGGEDLELFQRLWSGLPSHLYDTQIAASLVGFDRQTGLQRLLKESLDIDLGKEETRSDWTKRPLTESQIHYAAEDVRHLFRLKALLDDRLTTLNRQAWCQEECAHLLDKYRNKTPDDQLYLGFSSAARFKPEQQAALQHLVAWREDQARRRDIPRTFIAKDAVLYGLVEKQPRYRGALEDLGLQGGQIRRWGDELIKQLQIGLEKGNPSQLIPEPLSKRQQSLYKELRDVVAALATELALPPEVLASKAQLSDYLLRLLQGQDGGAVFSGWRGQILLPRLQSHRLSSQ
jgi:ribonuclease D